jgi:hypothetical protein
VVLRRSGKNNKSIDYPLTGLNQEEPLTVDIAAGTYADACGNQILAFSGNCVLDFDTMPLPGSLQPTRGEGRPPAHALP